MINNESPLFSIRKKLQLSLRDFGLLTGVYFLRILEIEKGQKEDIPLKLIDSLLELKLINSKEEFSESYKKFFSKRCLDLRERALNNV
jgi:transcriptional regulator with XRE-family HTH domain